MTTTGRADIDTLIHLIAGGMGGTAGAILTCPLEVVKTRLQSSNSGFSSTGSASGAGSASASGPSAPHHGPKSSSVKVVVPEIASEKRISTTMPVRQSAPAWLRPGVVVAEMRALGRTFLVPSSAYEAAVRFSSSTSSSSSPSLQRLPQNSIGMIECLRLIVRDEGVRGLFKGLGPNLVGVAPSRAIYFWAYSTAKKNVNASLPKRNRDTPFVHVVSASIAGFSASTATNPIWLVKTRLQLDRASGLSTLTVRHCVGKIYSELGALGFWRGVTASYWGISETVIHFVLYEYLKKELAEYQGKHKDREKTLVDFAGFMLCGACSKTCATVVAYPHEVARTRLREEGTKYRSFWQTLGLVAREEGRRGLYRGLATQLVRQIPNTAIMMSTYEMTVYVLSRWWKAPSGSDRGGPHSASQ